MHLLTLPDLVSTLKKNLHEMFLMQEIARTRSSSCKNLHHTMQVFRASLSLKWRGKKSCSRNMREQDFLPLQSQEYRGEMCEDRGNVWKPENSRARITPLTCIKIPRASFFSSVFSVLLWSNLAEMTPQQESVTQSCCNLGRKNIRIGGTDEKR